MAINNKLEYTVLDLIEASARYAKTRPLNLGGVSGQGGGIGLPPGGFIGQLPQTRVTYDTDEIASSGIPASGMSLLDNLNHIRYRLNTIESGGSIWIVDDNTNTTYQDVDTIHFSGAGVLITNLGNGDLKVSITSSGGGGGSALTVQESDGSPIVNNVDKIIFSGLAVEDLGSGDVRVSPIYNTASGDARYLKLDASNDPLTGKLSMYNPVKGGGGLYVETAGDSYTADFEQFVGGDDSITGPVIFGYRDVDAGGSIAANFLELQQYETDVDSITGNFAYFAHEGNERFRVTTGGGVYIPSGQYYNIDGVPHAHTYSSLTSKPRIADSSTILYNSPASTSSSAFSGTIATLPGGKTLTYNAVSGNEDTLPQDVAGTTRIAQQRLYNTTRGTYGLIDTVNTGTNTIVLVNNVPAGWATTDVITTLSQTVSGGGFNWVDLEITSDTFLGKSYVSVYAILTDTGGAGGILRAHPFETYSVSKIVRITTQSTQQNSFIYPTALNSNVLTVSWIATGAGTFTFSLRQKQIFE